MPVIKRYPNRKLYDTEAKRYVTLEQVAALIRQGEDVHVVDHESGEDLTNMILSQIILEQEKKQGGFLPRSLLTGLIRSGGETLDQMRHSVQSGLESARNLTDGAPLEAQITRLVESGKVSLEQVQSVLNLDDRVADVLHRLNVPTHQEMQALQAQLDALDNKLDQLLAAPPPRRKTKRTKE
jgi:polyhydroxyalkanoate synthesis repressor PhaR